MSKRVWSSFGYRVRSIIRKNKTKQSKQDLVAGTDAEAMEKEYLLTYSKAYMVCFLSLHKAIFPE